MPNDDPGILSWLVVVGLKRTWDQKRSSGMLLTFTVTLLFQFRLAVTEQYCLFTLTFFERVFNTESQGYLDELASDGKTAPRAALTRSSTSASSVEMMDFNLFHLMFHNNRVRETYTEHAKRCLTETTSPARRQFSPSGFSVRCPTAAVAMNSPSASRLSSSH